MRSDVSAPLIAALYVAMLPIWGLLLTLELSAAAPRPLFVLGYGALTVVSVIQFPRGLTIARQRVDADAAGLRLRGLGGFSVAWSDVATLTLRPGNVGANVVLGLAPGHAVRSQYLVNRTLKRPVGIEADAVDALVALAVQGGVEVARSV